MRVLITGDRSWTNRGCIHSWLSALLSCGYDTLIEGEARGADRIAKEEGRKLGFTIIPYPADWVQHGKKAGIIRNRQMVDEGKPDIVVWFHHNLAESKGTKDMVNYAISCGLTIYKGRCYV